MSNAQPLGGTAIKPKGWDRSGWESFKYMLYDPDEGKILTRTPMSWLKITLFYMVYYSLLAGFWLACMMVFLTTTIPDDEPRWQLDQSIIGTNPGVGLKPGNSDANIDSSMITIDLKDTSTTPTNSDGEGEKNADFAARMDTFLQKYKNNAGLKDCSSTVEEKGKCIFDMSELGPCSQSPYGYIPTDGAVKPCIFLKLNKIFGFDPVPVKADELDSEAYADMSAELKEKIRAAADQDQVFFDCFGRFAADREAVTLSYFPDSQGISTKYFPYKGGNYQSPLLAVQLDAISGQLIHMECRAWFHNVVHDKKDKAGLTQFEIYIN